MSCLTSMRAIRFKLYFVYLTITTNFIYITHVFINTLTVDNIIKIQNVYYSIIVHIQFIT